MLIISTGVGACGAHKQKPAAPASAGVVEIPTATQDQLKSFDSDDSALPAGKVHVATTATPPPPPRERQVDDPWGSSAWAQSPRGGPDCIALALCCEQMVRTKGAGPSLKQCGTLRNAPAAACRKLFPLFRQAAAQYGVSCP